MDRNEITEKVADLVAEIIDIDVDDFSEATTFDDIDADSLDRIELLMAIQNEFGFKFAQDELKRIESMGDAVDIIESHLA